MPIRLRSYTISGEDLTYDLLTDVAESDPRVPGDIPNLATVSGTVVTVKTALVNIEELDVTL